MSKKGVQNCIRKDIKMNKENLIKEVEKLAYQFEKEYGGCAQCVIGPIKKCINGISDDVFKAATGFSGGIGLTGKTCGALIGAVMVISTFIGREYNNFQDPEKVRFKTYKLTKKLVECFEAEYGSSVCYDIQKKIMDKSFNLWDEKEHRDFLEAGGHKDKCTAVCGNAAKWAVEFLTEAELVGE